MRPVDALTPHASSWGWLVTMSAFALLTAGLVMAVWWAAHRPRSAPRTYHVRGSVNGITLDLGDADVDDRRRRRRGRARGRAHRPLRVRPSAPRPSASCAAACCSCARAARPRCSAAARSSYRLRVPDNVPVTVRTTSGRRARPARYRGSARPSTTDLGRRRRRRLLRLPAAGRARDVGRRRAPTPPARPSGWSCARAPATCARRAAGPLPRRRRERRRAARSVRGVTAADDAPFQIQALSHARATSSVRERAVNAAPTLDFGAPPAARASQALAYLVAQPPARPRSALLAVGGVLVLGAALSPSGSGCRSCCSTVAACAAARRARAPPGQPAARRAHPAAAGARAPPGTPWRRALDDARRPRSFWRVLRRCCAQAAGRAGAARRRRCVPLASPSRCSCLGVQRRSAAAATATSSARGRSAPLTGLAAAACSRCRRRSCSRSPRSRRSARCCARSRARCSRSRRAREGPGARDARRAPRRPLADDRLLAARARDLRRRARAARSSCPTRAPAARGRRSSATGVRVAAIVHDAELDAGAGARHTPPPPAAALAIDNERLKADLRARVEELRVSRAAHRRGRRRRAPPDRARPPRRRPAAARLARARPAAAARRGSTDNEAARAPSTSSAEKLAVALAELRELARGIHPAILTERGLGAGRRGARGARAGAGRGRRRRSTSACRRAGRGRRLLRGRRGADQRRQVRRRPTTRASTVRRDERRRRGRGRATTASAAPTSTSGTGLRGLTTALVGARRHAELDSPPGGGTRLARAIPCERRPTSIARAPTTSWRRA